MKLLPRLYKPSEGRILIVVMTFATTRSVRRQIGIVPQDSLLFVERFETISHLPPLMPLLTTSWLQQKLPVLTIYYGATRWLRFSDW